MDRWFVWEAGQLLEELDSTAQHRVNAFAYRPGTDQPLARITGDAATTIEYVQQDGRGDVIGLTNGASVTQHVLYGPWGNVEGLSGDSLPVTGLGWKGLVWEGGTAQLYYVRARWYDPASRSFLSEDALGLAGGRNTYAYADNDPINGWDPSGLVMAKDPCDLWECIFTPGGSSLCDYFACGGSGGGGTGGLHGGGGGGGGGHRRTDPYPHKVAKRCPDFLRAGKIRQGLDDLYLASRVPRPHEEARAFLLAPNGVRVLDVGHGNCAGVTIAAESYGNLPVGSFAFAHSHPCAGMAVPGRLGVTYGQSIDYGDVHETARYNIPGFVVSKDSLYWSNPTEKRMHAAGEIVQRIRRYVSFWGAACVLAGCNHGPERSAHARERHSSSLVRERVCLDAAATRKDRPFTVAQIEGLRGSFEFTVV